LPTKVNQTLPFFIPRKQKQYVIVVKRFELVDLHSRFDVRLKSGQRLHSCVVV